MDRYGKIRFQKLKKLEEKTTNNNWVYQLDHFKSMDAELESTQKLISLTKIKVGYIVDLFSIFMILIWLMIALNIQIPFIKGDENMQAFIAGPLVNEKTRDLDFYSDIGKLCEKFDIDTFIPHRDTEPVDLPADSELVFEQDFEGLHHSNLIIAEVSNPSHGVGSELMQAYIQKIPIILLVSSENSQKLSRMVTGNPMVKSIISYKTKEECLLKLESALKNLKK
jgi:hypothetical protein